MSLIDLSNIFISPEVGLYIPLIQLKTEVFPAPLGPIIENNDPSFTSKDIPSRAFTPPKFNPTSLNSITFFMITNVSYVYSVLHP